MEFSSLLSTAASLAPTISGLLLQTTQADQKDYGFVRLNYDNAYVDGGFCSSGSYVSIELDDQGIAKSTSDLGTLVMRYDKMSRYVVEIIMIKELGVV
ncbi:hypothetical protein PT974_11929 [Cladobotryum mycophilum]|uniref:Uncharacterized protein n=1 Tax=Cladobotryum mycophilum TaxID=491253 RepID=A0ABR0S7P1_9HYPO